MLLLFRVVVTVQETSALDGTHINELFAAVSAAVQSDPAYASSILDVNSPIESETIDSSVEIGDIVSPRTSGDTKVVQVPRVRDLQSPSDSVLASMSRALLHVPPLPCWGIC
jgi:hypothetical protein